jgi:transposase
MPMPEHIATKVEELDDSARVVVEAIWQMQEELRAENEQLRANIEQLQRMLFGKRSEKMPNINDEVRRQISEEELTPELLGLDPDTPKKELDEARKHERRKRSRRASEPAREAKRKARKKLPVVRQEVLVRAEQLPEGLTRDDFDVVGSGSIVQRIEHVREHFHVTEYILETLKQRGGETIVKASPPPGVVDGGTYGPGVYARVAVSKCVDSMPFYRQQRTLARAGVPIARSVLCSLFHRAAEVLKPVYERLVEMACAHPYVHADETKLRIGEPKRARDAWVWTVLSEDVVAYVFSESRAAETPNHLLAGSNGVLMVDGYAGYNGVVGDEGRIRAGCWAHARRKFFEARGTAPEASEMLDLILKLYRVERAVADRGELGSDRHGEIRDSLSRELVDKIEAWVDERRGTVLPKGPLGTALEFAFNQRKALRQFLDDPKIALDNNIAERALRVVAVGRKNYLFVGHFEGGQNLTVLQTICHTCQLHGVNPYEYLSDVLVRVREHPASRLDELLPQNWVSPPV